MTKFSLSNPRHFKAVQAIILTVAGVDGYWGDIVGCVEELFEVENWLHVRSVLQGLKDAGFIEHDVSVTTEQFHLCAKYRVTRP